MQREVQSIKSKRLLLRPVVASDIQHIYRGLSDPEVIKYYGVSYYSLEATKEQMRWYEETEQCWWVICSLDGQEVYGAGGLNDISVEHKKAEIGLWLLPEYWGQGIMTEAMPIICNYGFKSLGLRRIEGFVESSNQNCKRAMAKLDFEYEGCMRDCEVKNGIFISVDIYAKLNK